MTYQEALKNRRECVKYLENCNKATVSQDCLEANKMAIEALKMRIPAKPDRSGDDEQDFYKCPSCGGNLGYLDDYFPKSPYCEECGQAIAWKKGSVEE